VGRSAGAATGIALGAGVFGAVQPKINAVLGDRVGSALVASLVNFTVALACVTVALALRPDTRRRLAGLRTWPVPRWTFTAGLGGVLVVVAGAVSVNTIGVAIFSVAFFAGQITSGLLVDRLGVGPGGRRPVTAPRVQAVVLAVTAVVVAQVGRPVGDIAPALVGLVVAAGAGVAFQSAFNARISVAVGDPVAATALNVTVGTVALLAIVGGLAGTGHLGDLAWPAEPWLYTGGVLGVTVVISLAIATSVLGVLRTTLAMLAAQMTAAFVVDWLVLRTPPLPGAVAGALLIVGAVGLVGRHQPLPAAPVGPR
jgi:bacterial/archaeal transporter family-2 protein